MRVSEWGVTRIGSGQRELVEGAPLERNQMGVTQCATVSQIWISADMRPILRNG